MMAQKAAHPRLALLLGLACAAAVLFMDSQVDVKESGTSAMDAAFEQINGRLDKEYRSGLSRVDRVLNDVGQFVEVDMATNEEAESHIQDGLAAKSTKVHDNVVAFKAYCVAAFDSVHDLVDHKTSSIVPIVSQFGKDGDNKNVILEYSKLFGKAIGEFKTGMGKYMLDKLNTALLTSKADQGIVVMQPGDNLHYVLDYSALGLQDLPRYFKKMRVNVQDFNEAYHKIGEANSNADAMAAVAFLKGKHNEEYMSFLDREIAKQDAIKAGRFKKIADHAFKAEVTAMDGSVENNPDAILQHVAVQAPAGRDAANEANGIIPEVALTMAQMQANAKAAADKYMADLKDAEANTEQIITNQENLSMGVHVTVTTSGKERGESSMQPTITIRGTKGDIAGTLNSLPLAGESMTQTFASDHPIGDIQSVEIGANGSIDPWLCASFKVKAGDEGPLLSMQQENFWLEGPGTKPIDHADLKYAESWTLTPRE
jgi:hypothetical protein